MEIMDKQHACIGIDVLQSGSSPQSDAGPGSDPGLSGPRVQVCQTRGWSRWSPPSILSLKPTLKAPSHTNIARQCPSTFQFLELTMVTSSGYLGYLPPVLGVWRSARGSLTESG